MRNSYSKARVDFKKRKLTKEQNSGQFMTNLPYKIGHFNPKNDKCEEKYHINECAHPFLHKI